MEKVVTYNLTENFIENLAGFVNENFIKQGRDISKIAFVFGGKRPALFLKRRLSGIIKTAFFSPKFFSMDEFIKYVVSKKGPFFEIADLDACFAIYKLAKETAPDVLKSKESFSGFLPWAREILSFIEQLDLEDVNVESLENIQFKARIGYDVPENINALLGSIISLRNSYNAMLEKNQAYSRGLAYLAASRYIGRVGLSEFSHIFFCGFFYLHKTESAIIKNLYDAGKAILFFQGDAEEWTVLEKLSKELSARIRPEKNRKAKCNLVVQAGFDAHSEVCLAREIFKTLKTPQDTVIVLPKSENLIPLLSEISGFADNFNVSMGYPLNRSSVYSLFQCIFKAQETKKGDRYYTKDYLNALGHPLIKNLRLTSNPAMTRVLAHKVEEIVLGMRKSALGGSLFVTLSDVQNSSDLYEAALETMKNMGLEAKWDELKNIIEQLHGLLFVTWGNINNFYDFSLALGEFLGVIVNKSPLAAYPLNLKMAEKIFSIKEELANASFNREPFSREDIFKIFDNKLNSEMISFSGSPLKGVQILGLFETRSLSFDNVIIMDVNEASLPSIRVYEPLIPREVMICLGINRLEKEEEIQRYQFRRLISSAKNACLIYQQRPDKEKSRFIEELVWERQKALGRLDVLPVPQASFSVKVLPKRHAVKKDEKTIKFLEGFRYSSSSVNMYMRCPLMFYYEYVLGLEEREDSLEEPQGADIGTFIHELLHQAFSGFVGRKPYIDARFREYFFSALNKKFADEFQKKMKSDSFLLKKILDFRMERFLDNEIRRDVKEILCLEKVFEGRIGLGGRAFRFKAIIDRIDRLSDGSVLIIDYKTGGADMPTIGIEKIESSGFSRRSLKKTVKSFQLPLYLYFVGNDSKYGNGRLNACLYPIRESGGGFDLNRLFKKEDDFNNKDKIVAVYLKALEAVLQDILNPDNPFCADEEDSRQCSNCQFFYLCR